MYKNNLKNVFKYPLPEANASTSPAGGEVLNSVCNASALNVIFRRELSELSGESRNFMAILLNATDSIVIRLFSVTITGFIPVILAQRGYYLVNKFAVLLHKYRFSQDCRNRLCVMSGNDGKRQELGVCCNVLSTPHSALKRHFLPQGAREQGRSMIEMLGVLAIIAVLSVGGIAGYSKAMEKWKINQQLDILSQLLTSVIKFREELGKNIIKGENPGGILPLLEAVGDIPDKLSYSQIQPTSDGVWYSDNFGILYNVLYNVATWKCGSTICSSKEANMNVILTKSSGKLTSSSYNLCLNILDFAKHNTDNIWRISIWNYQGNSLRSNLDYKQIANATIEKFSSMCQSCNNDNLCRITMYIYMN